MTTVQDTDARFAWISQHGGPVVDWSNAQRWTLAGEGLTEWIGSAHSEQNEPTAIRKHVPCEQGLRMLEIRLTRHAAPGEGPVRWEATLKVPEDRYVRTYGSAADFPTALAQVEAHVHQSRQLGGLTWWSETPNHWISWMGAFELSATQITQSQTGREAYWHFQVRGDAPTLEEAALLASLGRLNVIGAGAGAGGGQGT